jgi:glucosylceramidase
MTGPSGGNIYYTVTNGAIASFTFQAPARFIFYYAKYTTRGKFEIWVDGVRLVTIDPYATTRTWQNKYTSPVYSDTNAHTVEIKNISPNGMQVDIDAIEIAAPPAPAGPGLYQDTDAGWTYSGSWAASTGMTGPSGGNIYYTVTTGASASFTFQAPARFIFYYAQHTNRGPFEIWVDGSLLTTIDPYATTRTWQNTYTSPVYTDTATHTVEIKNISPNGMQVDIDAILIE